ncbi:MAG: Adenosine monophosphate-protein transferase SoFic [Syntrophorhabdus sp. PtaU1.Bin002]|nr:MAG: Adenosine monophosphate-protein transferase SoFic [Syntrophorhabdus sp. PtaB.Bin006]OPY62561.1 MAG: Adenosine monophosphate-protein transferase SoFic [Syntrophorhabdus sp. PtaU1.Bin002]
MMTFKSGKFVFSHKYDVGKLAPMIVEARILYQTVKDLPILPSLAAGLEEEIIRRSIFSTAAIEGNPLPEESVAGIVSQLAENTNPERAEKEIQNLKVAYELLVEADPKNPVTALDENHIRQIHSIITNGIEHEHNVPGLYRNHRVKVGDGDHGGVYTPPKCLADIENLMKEFLGWINSDNIMSLDPILRAGLAHYYLGLIHPFGDGNGRTARLIEALLMKSSGIRYAPIMLSNFYYTNIDEYFRVFSITRQDKEHMVTPFLEFVVKGVIASLYTIKDKIVYFIRQLILRDYYAFLLKEKKLSGRQHDLLTLLFENRRSFRLTDLFTVPMLRVLYKGVSERTARRDLKTLCDLGVLTCEKDTYDLNLRTLG